jgi:CRP-like cAMP-binding protein
VKARALQPRVTPSHSAPTFDDNQARSDMLEPLAAYLAQYQTLSERDLLRLVPLLKRRRVLRKERLFAAGEVHGVDLFVESGCLRIYSGTDDGAERILLFGTEDTWWCHNLMAGARLLQNVGIDALERTDVLILDPASKEQLCRDVPAFDRLFRLLAQGTLEALQQRLVLSLQHTADLRYQEFTRLHPTLEGRIPRYHVASYLGICPEFFSKLRKGGVARRAS